MGRACRQSPSRGPPGQTPARCRGEPARGPGREGGVGPCRVGDGPDEAAGKRSTRFEHSTESALEVAALELLAIVDDHGEGGMCPSQRSTEPPVVRVRQHVNASPDRGGCSGERRLATTASWRPRAVLPAEHLQHVDAARPLRPTTSRREACTVRSTQMGDAASPPMPRHTVGGPPRVVSEAPARRGPAMRAPRLGSLGGGGRCATVSLSRQHELGAHRRRALHCCHLLARGHGP